MARRVVIIEDGRDVARLLELFRLRGAGFAVASARSAQRLYRIDAGRGRDLRRQGLGDR